MKQYSRIIGALQEFVMALPAYKYWGLIALGFWISFLIWGDGIIQAL